MKHRIQIKRRKIVLMGIVLCGMWLSGSETTSAALELANQIVIEEVELINEEGVVLAGTLFNTNKNEIAVVLAHSGVLGEDQEGLHPIAQSLAEAGKTSLTFDFQGYGRTGGETAYAEVDQDAKAAVTYLRNNGYQKIACMGVGLGGTACLKVSRESNIAGLLVISAPLEVTTGKLIKEPELDMVITKLEVTEDDLHNLGYPILVIAAEEDNAAGRPFAEMARNMYEYASEPKEIVIFPGTEHSMELFRSDHGEEMKKLVFEFFEGLD